MAWRGFPRYVPVAERRLKAEMAMEKLTCKGTKVQPVVIEGREIAGTFWGKGWCRHLESFSDFENRLPRGRSYVRHGSVCHLEILPGVVKARVSGSRLYTVTIKVGPLDPGSWARIKQRCTGRIDSIIDLLQGSLSSGVMAVVADRDRGLFPKPREISMSCTCPDEAIMCKHVAAALYGVGARLDSRPELLFVLRGVNHEELIGAKAEAAVEAVVKGGSRKRIADKDLGEVFGVEVETPVERTEGVEKKAATKRAAPGKAGGKRRASRPATVREVKGKRRAAASPPHRKAKGQRAGGRETPARESAAHRWPAFPEELTGGHVRILRDRLGLSQKGLADLLEVSHAAVSVWERTQGPVRFHGRTREAMQRAWDLAARHVV